MQHANLSACSEDTATKKAAVSALLLHHCLNRPINIQQEEKGKRD